MIRLRQLVHYAGLCADAVKGVSAKIYWRGPIPVLGQISESHAIIRKNGVNPIRKHGHDAAQESCTIHLANILVELDICELPDPVDHQKHVKLALGKAKLRTLNVDVSDHRIREPTTL